MWHLTLLEQAIVGEDCVDLSELKRHFFHDVSINSEAKTSELIETSWRIVDNRGHVIL